MTETKRLGRKGRGDVKLTRDDRSVLYLTAYEVRAAYRALYASPATTRRRRAEEPPAEPSEIDRAHAGKLGAAQPA